MKRQSSSPQISVAPLELAVRHRVDEVDFIFQTASHLFEGPTAVVLAELYIAPVTAHSWMFGCTAAGGFVVFSLTDFRNTFNS